MLDNPEPIVTGSCELPTASALDWRAIPPVSPPFYFFKLHLLITYLKHLLISLSFCLYVCGAWMCVCVCIVNMYVRYVCGIYVCTCLVYTRVSTCIDTDVHARMRKLKFYSVPLYFEYRISH